MNDQEEIFVREQDRGQKSTPKRRSKPSSRKAKTGAKAAPRKPGPKKTHRTCPTCNGKTRILDARKDFTRVEVREIAKAAGRSPSMISRFLQPPSAGTKKRDTTFAIAKRIADYLGITMDELWSIVMSER